MNVEHLNPFVSATSAVVESVLGQKAVKGELSVLPDNTTHQQVSIMIGVTGNLVGQVIFGMSLVTACRVASTMIGEPTRTFDKLAASAVAELGNMISGQALQALSNLGYVCEITPPSVIKGANVSVSLLTMPSIVVQFSTLLGAMSVSIGLVSATERLAA